MNFLRIISITAILASSFSLNAQKAKKGDKLVATELKTIISFLADDKLEGRRAGSPGEQIAMEFISAQFKNNGLQPKGTNGFYQEFDINEGKELKPDSYFSVNGTKLKESEYFTFPFSANKTLEASPAIAIQEEDMPWFVDLKEILVENKANPHFDLTDYIRTNSKKAYDKGANAVIIYNTSATDDKLAFNPKDKSALLKIPVFYVTAAAAKKHFSDVTATLNLKMKVNLGEKKRIGHNVIGFIDNGANYTVVLGAHFDHLGYGEDGNSMMRTGDKMIHNGADDNASGTAALIELSKLLKTSKAKKNNYLFIAFSGEELGLFGSKYFIDKPTIDLAKVNYMINMDMIGRLNDSTHSIAVGGFGTSPTWASVIRQHDKKVPFSIKIDSSGTGPSDHTSFYKKDIPVLFFFTGQHKDYHRPSDDADKINYDGEVQVINYINNLITTLNKEPAKLVFQKTRDAQVSVSAFKVTMGIMPDYTYDGTGVRADGVSEGRPAFKAGLKTGDVIIQLGSQQITSMETYMKALNQFNKGDKTKVKYKRGNEEKESDIEF